MSFRRVKAGDPVRIPAPAYNAWCEAAEAFQAGNQGFRSESTPRPRRELGTVVLVKNTDTGQKNWSPFSPVVVTPPGGSPASSALEFAAHPHFRGNQPTGTAPLTPGDVIGAAQEPIPYGRMGRVSIAGLSCALVSYEYEGTGQSYAEVHWDSAHSRLVWQRGVWGHARFLLRLDDTPYQDGTYNDQYLSLIDLNPGPQKLWGKLGRDLKDGASAYVVSVAETVFAVCGEFGLHKKDASLSSIVKPNEENKDASKERGCVGVRVGQSVAA